MLGGCTSVINNRVCKFSGILWSHRRKIFRQQVVKLFDPSFRSLRKLGHQAPNYALYPAFLLLEGLLIFWQLWRMNTTSQATTSEALLYIDQAEMSAKIPQLESKPLCTAYVVLRCTEVKHYWKCTLKETVSFVKKDAVTTPACQAKTYPCNILIWKTERMWLPYASHFKSVKNPTQLTLSLKLSPQ